MSHIHLVSCLIILTVHLAGADWLDPPFTNPKDAHIVDDDWAWDSAENKLKVKFNEEIDGNIVIAVLNYEGGEYKPTIQFSSQNERQLGLVIQDKNLVVTKKQDYENPNEQSFIFFVYLNDADREGQKVLVTINNIDDNDPTIISNQQKCRIQENYHGPSNCTYLIGDVEMPVGNLHFDLISGSSTDVPDLFEFKLLDKPTETANGYLNVKKNLDAETAMIYYFTLRAMDPNSRNQTAPIWVEVQDVNDNPPKWQKIPLTVTIEEESETQIIDILAYDGDISLHAEINYKLKENYAHVSIPDPAVGQIRVEKIDRESLENDNFEIVVIAYEKLTPEMEINSTITIMVTDINDNAPVISPQHLDIEIPENMYTKLDKPMSISDIDLGINAQYSVQLLNVENNSTDFTKAFQIIPSQGYMKTDVSISVLDATMLDFDRTAEWRNFQIKIESNDGQNRNTSIVNITLRNWNDEVPFFNAEKYTFPVMENVEENSELGIVNATDYDIDDYVTYSIVGDSFKGQLTIGERDGIVQTIAKNVFDYERQKNIIIQIEAKDNLDPDDNKNHKIFTQLEIELINVNDEAPKITLPRNGINVTENSDVNFIVTNVTASDADGDIAKLEFHIDWDQTFATKPGKSVPKEDYFGCLDIITLDTDENGSVTGQIIVNGPIDFEKFEMLNLAIVVTDLNQTIGTTDDTAILAITILDENDCFPIFDQQITPAYKSVIEKSEIETLIGRVLASDADGPEYNQIRYSIKEIDETLPYLVHIDEKFGEITVNGTISADIKHPDGSPTLYLMYEVYASDGKNKNHTTINITIIDTNDVTPSLNTPLETKRIPECTSGDSIQIIDGIDTDRDEFFHTITYELNTLGHPDLQKLFSVNPKTGMVSINNSTQCDLSRDFGPENYTIYLILQDNIGGQGKSNRFDTNFNIILTDINNQKPLLPDNKTIMSVSEKEIENVYIDTITATDKDEPNTNNSKISYQITAIYSTKNSSLEPEENLFIIDPDNGRVSTGTKLEGFYGSYIIEVTTRDFGDPILSDSKNYTIDIEKYNFRPPKIIFPHANAHILLDKSQQLRHILYTLNGSLETFEADDQQHKKYNVQFRIISPNDGVFFMSSNGPGLADLEMQKQNDKMTYKLTIEAYHEGSGNNSVQTEITIYFIDQNLQPIFKDQHMKMSILENCTDATLNISTAKYPDDTPTEFIDIYYFLVSQDGDNFQLDPETGILSLNKPLDREEKDFYNLTIVANNNEYGPPTKPQPQSCLYLEITVEDVNDNIPSFAKKDYSGALLLDNPPNTNLLTVHATDLDSLDDGKLKYEYLQSTLNVSDDSLKKIKENGDAFTIDANGVIYNKFMPQEEMRGYFTFDVEVIDTAKHTDTAHIKIFLISKENVITFRFHNDVDFVTASSDYISETLTKVLEVQCIVDRINKVSTNETDVQTHFIDEEGTPVSKDDIMKITGDLATISKLQAEFWKMDLNFSDVPNKPIPENIEKLLKIILIVVSVVLSSLCIFLFVLLIIRTRRLNRQLDAMKTDIFGSTSSNLNRLGANAPNTNKHAIEANPVWNEQFKPDQGDNISDVSQSSDNSDLIGIEDSPEFQYSFNNSKDDEETLDRQRKKSINPLATGELNIGCTDERTVF